MRIALVSRRYPPQLGGAEKMFCYLAESFAKAGADVSVVACQTLPPIEHEVESSVLVERLPSSRMRFLGTLRYMAELGNWFRRHHVDIAYISMLKHDAFVAVGSGKALGFPVVLRPEGAGKTGDLAWQTWGRFGKRIGRRCRQADAFVSISRAITDELLASGYDRSRIQPLPNGVPVPTEAWSVDQRIGEPKHAVFVGRLAPEKNLSVLLEAWKLVRSAQSNARLTIVGDGPEKGVLETQIDQLGLRGSVKLAGAIANPLPIERDADLFILPSIEEGMSIALLEALALGMPVVVSDIPGNRSIVEPNQQGLLTDPRNPQSLSEAILAIFENPSLAQSLGKEARERVIESYSIDAVATSHLHFFEQVIDRHKQERRTLESREGL